MTMTSNINYLSEYKMKKIKQEIEKYPLFNKLIEDGYKIIAIHPYTDKDGNVLFYKLRFKNPESGKKEIRPVHYNNNRIVMGEKNTRDKKPLYNLKMLLERKNQPVWICEGENCVDKLTESGVLATTSGGANSMNQADWSVLSGRDIILWPDNDEQGIKYAHAVGTELSRLGCKTKLVDIDKLNLPDKGDCVDWHKMQIDNNIEVTEKHLAELPQVHFNPKEKNKSPAKNKTPPSGQPIKIINFIKNNYLLFRNENNECFIQDKKTNEITRLDKKDNRFRTLLQMTYYKETGATLREQAITDAVGTLIGLTIQQGERHEVFIRAGQHEYSYYLDLGQAKNNRVVEITAEGWQIVDNASVKFFRPDGLLSLPDPDKNGDISPLWDLINIPEEDRILVIAWLCECLRSNTPFPILELFGEQGSAKSTTQDILRSVIDPNHSNLRSPPRKIDDVFATAYTNLILSYENISTLNHAMQNTFCSIATGVGDASRKLFTNYGEALIKVKRPIILNGISICVVSQDLVDRTVMLELPAITERIEISTLKEKFNQYHASILGGLLNIMASALSYLPEVRQDKSRERLIEFFYLGKAVNMAMKGTSDHFETTYRINRNNSILQTIEESSVASAIIEWAENPPFFKSGATKQLWQELEKYNPRNSYYDRWPKTPRAFGDEMRRIATALRKVYGIKIERKGKISGNVYYQISVEDEGID
jgi:hypothetical protein